MDEKPTAKKKPVKKPVKKKSRDSEEYKMYSKSIGMLMNLTARVEQLEVRAIQFIELEEAVNTLFEEMDTVLEQYEKQVGITEDLTSLCRDVTKTAREITGLLRELRPADYEECEYQEYTPSKNDTGGMYH